MDAKEIQILSLCKDQSQHVFHIVCGMKNGKDLVLPSNLFGMYVDFQTSKFIVHRVLRHFGIDWQQLTDSAKDSMMSIIITLTVPHPF